MPIKPAYELTALQRDLLIEHMDDRRIPIDLKQPHTYTLQRSLVGRGLLRWNYHEHASAITDEGREVLARVLSNWAEAIVRARNYAERRSSETVFGKELAMRQRLAEIIADNPNVQLPTEEE